MNKEITLSVPDISCEHCERTVMEALQGRPGVNSVRVNIPEKKVMLSYDESTLPLEQVKEILDEEGYPVAGSADSKPTDNGPRGFIPLSSK